MSSILAGYLIILNTPQLFKNPEKETMAHHRAVINKLISQDIFSNAGFSFHCIHHHKVSVLNSTKHLKIWTFAIEQLLMKIFHMPFLGN